MRIGCLLFGHTSYHLSAAQVAHCHRCGRPNEAWFATQRLVQQIRDAGKRSAHSASFVAEGARIIGCTCGRDIERTTPQQALDEFADHVAEAAVSSVRAINDLDPIEDGNGRHSSPLELALFNAWADMDETTGDYEAGQRLADAAMHVVDEALNGTSS